MLAQGLVRESACQAGEEPQGEALRRDVRALATCRGCKCTVGCTATLELHGMDDRCRGGAANKMELEAQCVDLTFNPSVYFKPEPVTGTCAAQGAPPPPDVEWGTTRRLCLPPGQLPCETLGCLRERRSLCLAVEGAGATCPSGFTSQGTYYRSHTDRRTCERCRARPECGVVRFYDAPQCMGAATATLAKGQCRSRMAGTHPRLELDVGYCTSSVKGTEAPQPAAPATLCCPT